MINVLFRSFFFCATSLKKKSLPSPWRRSNFRIFAFAKHVVGRLGVVECVDVDTLFLCVFVFTLVGARSNERKIQFLSVLPSDVY